MEYELSSLNTADEGFEITLDVLLDLTSCSHSLFESSSNKQKQQILQIIFSNLLLNGKNPYVTLAKPFDKFVNWSEFTSWRGLIETLRTCVGDIVAFYPNIQQVRNIVNTLQAA